jgi:hypothetical protein
MKIRGTGVQWDASASVYAGGVYLLGKYVNLIKKITEVLVEGGNGRRVEVSAENAKCLFVSRYQNAEENHNI